MILILRNCQLTFGVIETRTSETPFGGISLKEKAKSKLKVIQLEDNSVLPKVAFLLKVAIFTRPSLKEEFMCCYLMIVKYR